MWTRMNLFIVAGAALVIVGICVLVFKFARRDVAKVVDQCKKVLQAIWFLWCPVRTIVWKLRVRVREEILQTAIGTLTLASVWVLIESAMGSGRRLVHVGLAALLPQVVPGNAAPPSSELPGIPLWAELALTGLALLLLRYHWREFRRLRERWTLPRSSKALISDLQNVRTAPKPEERKELFEKFLGKLLDVLETGNSGKLAVSLMEKSGEEWVVFCRYPPNSNIDANIKLGLNEGGAGAAATGKVPVYIPSTRHLCMIDMKTWDMLGATYKRFDKKEPFRSMICIPKFSGADVTGVLNFASGRHSAFSTHDIDVGELASEFLTALDAALKGK
jgi:hypothetical protein